MTTAAKGNVRRLALVGSLIGYVAFLAALVVGLVWARNQTLETMSSPEALAAHQAWKRETERQSSPDYEGPVRRKAVVVDEPPGLILMRDHFLVIVLVGALVGTVLYGFLAITFYGSFLAGDRRPIQSGPQERA